MRWLKLQKSKVSVFIIWEMNFHMNDKDWEGEKPEKAERKRNVP